MFSKRGKTFSSGTILKEDSFCFGALVREIDHVISNSANQTGNWKLLLKEEKMAER